MGTVKPLISRDPQDVTFSYQTSSDMTLWGPYCYKCMNRWKDYFSEENYFYLHYKSHGKMYKLEQLHFENGKETPFTSKSLVEEVRVYLCRYPKCQRWENAPTMEFIRPTSSSSQISSEHSPVTDSPRAKPKNWIRRDLPKGNPVYVTNRRPVAFPLLDGTCFPDCKAASDDEWDDRAEKIMYIYKRIIGKPEEIKKSFDYLNWKTVNCEVCEYINPTQPYVEHVLSSSHHQNLRDRGRWVTTQHFDVLDRHLRKLENIIRNSIIVNYDKISVLQQYPLFPMWSSPHSTQMPREEFVDKMSSLRDALKSVDRAKLNERNEFDVTRETCHWCGTWINTMSELLDHLVTKAHMDILYDKMNVSVREINGYINIAKQDIRKSPSANVLNPPNHGVSNMSSVIDSPPIKGNLTKEKDLLLLPFLKGHTNHVPHPLTLNEAIEIGDIAKTILHKDHSILSRMNAHLLKKGKYLLECLPCGKRFPGPSAVLQHSISPDHIKKLANNGCTFSKLHDHCTLVHLLFSVMDLGNDIITMENLQKSFDKLKASISKKSIGKTAANLAPTQKSHNKAPASPIQQQQGPETTHIIVSKLEHHSTPSLQVRNSQLVENLTITDCTQIAKEIIDTVRKDENNKGISGNGYIMSAECHYCKKTLLAPLSILEHFCAPKHIKKVYAKGNRFSNFYDYFGTMLPFIKLETSNALTISELSQQIITSFVMMQSSKLPKSDSQSSVNSKSSSVTASSARSSSVVSVASSIDAPVPSKNQNCKMSRFENETRCVTFMNVESNYGVTMLSEAQLRLLGTIIKKELNINTKCLNSSYGELAFICPMVCPICQYRPLCCCDYVIHLFSPVHFNKLIENNTKISVVDVDFWLNQLIELKRHSNNPENAKMDDHILSKCHSHIEIFPNITTATVISLSRLKKSDFLQ